MMDICIGRFIDRVEALEDKSDDDFVIMKMQAADFRFIAARLREWEFYDAERREAISRAMDQIRDGHHYKGPRIGA